MAFLKRAKSQKVKAVKEVQKEENVPEQTDAVKNKRKSRHERRRSIFDRSKSADAHKSIERPRSADRLTDRGNALQPLGETIEIREGGDTFSFPTPSPRLPPNKRGTFLAVPSPLGSETASIGVAIGSPRQAKLHFGRTHTADLLTSTTVERKPPPARAHTMQTVFAPSSDASTDTPQLRKKKSGWKTLGGLFQRGSPKAAVQEPFYKVRLESNQTPAQSRPLLATPPFSSNPLRSPGSISSHHSRTPSISRGSARAEARAEGDRTSFMPNHDSKMRRSPSVMFRSASNALSQKPLPGIRDSEDMFKTAEEERHDSPLSASGMKVPDAIPRTPRLDLNIPNAELERYSVMFEKLLEPRQSILERRQSKMKRLKPNAKTEEVATAKVVNLSYSKPETVKSIVPQRSMTSSHLTKVPSLKIKITHHDGTSKDDVQTAIHRPRPPKRSNTAPTGSVSESAPNFSRPKPPTVSSSESQRSPSSPLYGENSLPPTPTTVTTFADNESIIISNHEPLPPISRFAEKAEPSWDMLTSKPVKMTIDEDSRVPYLRVKSPEDLERQIVQVSVARQVSVSRARRQVQQATTSVQPLRPRVVELSKNRKSTVVLIESGDD